MTTHTTPPLVVVNTQYVEDRAPAGGPHYEVHLASNADGPRLVLVTTDSVAYQDALDIEGTAQRVRATWHWESGRRQVLDALEFVP